MRPTPLAQPNPEPSPRGSWLIFCLTIFVILAFFSIGFMIYPPLFVVIGILFAGIGLQYLIWGRWMERNLRDEKPVSPDGSEPTPLAHHRSDVELPPRDL